MLPPSYTYLKREKPGFGSELLPCGLSVFTAVGVFFAAGRGRGIADGAAGGIVVVRRGKRGQLVVAEGDEVVGRRRQVLVVQQSPGAVVVVVVEIADVVGGG